MNRREFVQKCSFIPFLGSLAAIPQEKPVQKENYQDHTDLQDYWLFRKTYALVSYDYIKKQSRMHVVIKFGITKTGLFFVDDLETNDVDKICQEFFKYCVKVKDEDRLSDEALVEILLPNNKYIFQAYTNGNCYIDEGFIGNYKEYILYVE